MSTAGLLTGGAPAQARSAECFSFTLTLQRCIESAIRTAWQEVASSWTPAPGSAGPDIDEPTITTELVKWMNSALDREPEPVAGFNSKFFETVVRGAEITNYDGKALEKRPDMTFRCCGKPEPGYAHYDRTHHALFVECKIIDQTHKITRYWSEGLVRFVRGDYAWRMQHALMVAYALGPQRIEPHLNKILRPGSKAATQSGLSGALYPRDPGLPSSVFVSIHRRTPEQLGEIKITHLWLCS